MYLYRRCHIIPGRLRPASAWVAIDNHLHAPLYPAIASFDMAEPSQMPTMHHALQATYSSPNFWIRESEQTLSFTCTLYIQWIMALSFRTILKVTFLVGAQYSLACSIALRTQLLYANDILLHVDVSSSSRNLHPSSSDTCDRTQLASPTGTRHITKGSKMSPPHPACDHRSATVYTAYHQWDEQCWDTCCTLDLEQAYLAVHYTSCVPSAGIHHKKWSLYQHRNGKQCREIFQGLHVDPQILRFHFRLPESQF